MVLMGWKLYLILLLGLGAVASVAQPTSFSLGTAPEALVAIPCENITSCVQCASNSSCFWCGGICTSSVGLNAPVCARSSVVPGLSVGWCNGDACDCRECLNRVFPCTNSPAAALFLMGTYLFLVALGSFSISVSTLRILERAGRFAHAISSLVAPIMSTTPLTALLLSSAFANVVDSELTSYLETAMGALTGSTVYLLTLLWVVSLWRGRCDFDSNGEAINGVAGRLTWASLSRSGVSVEKETLIAGRVMIMTIFSYFIIQGPAFQYVQQPVSALARQGERFYALAAFIVCSILLIAYFFYTFFYPTMAKLRLELAKDVSEERILRQRIQFFISKFRVYQDQLGRAAGDPAIAELRDPLQAAAGIWGVHQEARGGMVLNEVQDAARLRRRGHPQQQQHQQQQPAAEVQEDDEVVEIRRHAVVPNRPRFMELDDLAARQPQRKPRFQQLDQPQPEDAAVPEQQQEQRDDRFSESDSDEPDLVVVAVEGPPKRKHAEKVVQPIDAPVPAAERMREKLLAADGLTESSLFFLSKALLLLAFGVVVSVIFADAAATASVDLSLRLGAHPFYVAFFAFPIALNIPDFFVSYRVAGHRRRHMTSLSFASLYNSATLNNLVGLGVFCAVVFGRSLSWTFSAETIVTLLASCVVGLIGSLTRNIPLWAGIPVALVYPISILVFRFLEHFAKWT